MAGVLTGLGAGVMVGTNSRQQGTVLRSLFALTAVALTAISLVSTPAVAKAMHEASPDWLYAVLLVLMAFAGAGSLGFMGLGLRSCAE